MAEIVAEFPEHKFVGKAKHPWDQWFDGQIWKLVLNEDFHTPPQNFRAQCYSCARKRGKQIKAVIKENVIYLQVI